MAGRNRDRSPEIATGTAEIAGADVRILLLLAIEDHVTVDDRDPVARAGDDPLDEGLGRFLRRRSVARLGVPGALVRIAAHRVGVVVGPRRRVEDDDVADTR